MTKPLLCLLLLTAFPSQLFAQDPDGSAVPSPNLHKIYSNLGNGNGNCYGTEGWTVGQGQFIAMPFTPKANAKATELVLGFFSVLEGHEAIVSLNRDSNGLPGQAIYTWKLKKLGTSHFHNCYATIVKPKKALALRRGAQYWVVAAAPPAAWDVWDYTYSGAMGNFAYEEDKQGWISDYGDLGGFGVFGSVRR